jgi:hypothetical protein
MWEARLLSLVARNPHPTALARQVQDGSMFVGLDRLESRRLVRRERGLYRLTSHGRDELAWSRALTGLVAGARHAAT